MWIHPDRVRANWRSIPFLAAAAVVAGVASWFPELLAPYRKVVGGVCIGLLFVAMGARVWPGRFE